MHDEIESDDNGESMELDMPLALEAASQVVLEIRAQNVELLKLAAEVAGFSGSHPALKPNDLRQAVNAIWEVYSQFYQWIDPEDSGEDDDEEDDEE
jgi:hypothetical protein